MDNNRPTTAERCSWLEDPTPPPARPPWPMMGPPPPPRRQSHLESLLSPNSALTSLPIPTSVRLYHPTFSHDMPSATILGLLSKNDLLSVRLASRTMKDLVDVPSGLPASARRGAADPMEKLTLTVDAATGVLIGKHDLPALNTIGARCGEFVVKFVQQYHPQEGPQRHPQGSGQAGRAATARTHSRNPSFSTTQGRHPHAGVTFSPPRLPNRGEPILNPHPHATEEPSSPPPRTPPQHKRNRSHSHKRNISFSSNTTGASSGTSSSFSLSLSNIRSHLQSSSLHARLSSPFQPLRNLLSSSSQSPQSPLAARPRPQISLPIHLLPAPPLTVPSAWSVYLDALPRIHTLTVSLPAPLPTALGPSHTLPPTTPLLALRVALEASQHLPAHLKGFKLKPLHPIWLLHLRWAAGGGYSCPEHAADEPDGGGNWTAGILWGSVKTVWVECMYPDAAGDAKGKSKVRADGDWDAEREWQATAIKIMHDWLAGFAACGTVEKVGWRWVGAGHEDGPDDRRGVCVMALEEGPPGAVATPPASDVVNVGGVVGRPGFSAPGVRWPASLREVMLGNSDVSVGMVARIFGEKARGLEVLRVEGGVVRFAAEADEEAKAWAKLEGLGVEWKEARMENGTVVHEFHRERGLGLVRGGVGFEDLEDEDYGPDSRDDSETGADAGMLQFELEGDLPATGREPKKKGTGLKYEFIDSDEEDSD